MNFMKHQDAVHDGDSDYDNVKKLHVDLDISLDGMITMQAAHTPAVVSHA